MILSSPAEVAFSVGSFSVYWYGIILAFACFLAVFVAQKLYSLIYKDGIADVIWDLSPFVLIFGIIGARIYYCVLNFSYYFANPLEIFYFRGGGLSIHGGIFAGIVGLWLASKFFKVSFLRLLDVFAVGTILAQSLGRWGNFFNNEAFGLPTDGFLKLYVPVSARPVGFEGYEYFQPTFLYESFANFLIFVFLIFVIRKFGVKFEGLTLSLYLMLYSLVRFFIEGLRLDSAMNLGDWHIAQVMSVIIFVFALLFGTFVIIQNRKKFDF